MKHLETFYAILFINTALAAKILLIPPQLYSHIQTLTVIGEELVKRSHQVDCVIASWLVLPKSAIEAGIKRFDYQQTDQTVFMAKLTNELMKPENQGLYGMHKTMQKYMPYINEGLATLLSFQNIERIKNEKYDFILVNGLGYLRILTVIPEMLNIPFAAIVGETPTDLLSILFRLPSIDPHGIGGVYLGSKMNIFSRIMNAGFYTLSSMMKPGIDIDPYLVNATCKDLKCIAAKTSFWIVDRSPLLINALPKGPNMIHVPGLASNDPKPMAEDLRTYADSAKDGLVVVSFGSAVTLLPVEKLSQMFEAMKQLPKLKFIFRQKELPTTTIPANVKIVKWLPQVDLLGHPNTVLFITHCGNSGIHESLRHGVPMLGMPIYGDQPINALMIEDKGYGKSLPFVSFTSERLVNDINELLIDRNMKATLKKVSEITKSYPLPRTQAADAIEHVIKFGSDHLRSSSSDLYWFQILMWDIAYFVLIIVLLGISIVYLILKLLIKKFCKKKEKIM